MTKEMQEEAHEICKLLIKLDTARAEVASLTAAADAKAKAFDAKYPTIPNKGK